MEHRDQLGHEAIDSTAYIQTMTDIFNTSLERTETTEASPESVTRLVLRGVTVAAMSTPPLLQVLDL